MTASIRFAIRHRVLMLALIVPLTIAGGALMSRADNEDNRQVSAFFQTAVEF